MEQATALDSSVLVVNRFFSAVHVVSAKRAFSLLAKATAEVIAVDGGDMYQAYNFESWKEVSQFKARFEGRDEADWVRCVSFEIQVPKVIRLLVYDRFPQRTVRFNRRNVFARDENRCQYCGRKFPTSELSIDHVIPSSRGGKTTWANVVCCCVECNKRKGGMTPREAKLTLTRKPARPKRSPVLTLKLRSEKYRSWNQFIDNAYWSVTLK